MTMTSSSQSTVALPADRRGVEGVVAGADADAVVTSQADLDPPLAGSLSRPPGARPAQGSLCKPAEWADGEHVAHAAHG
jgi:hypothetical protein